MSGPAEGEPARPCEACGGEVIEGAIGLGLFSSARCSVPVGGIEVTVPLTCFLCSGCGTVRLAAKDLARIRSARNAITHPEAADPMPSRSAGGPPQGTPRAIRRAAETYRLLGALRHPEEVDQ